MKLPSIARPPGTRFVLREEAPMPHRRIPFLIVCAALIVLLAAPALAPTPGRGRIAGTVRDANGSPVGGAGVTITNQETGATRVVRSGAGGSYEAADLPPGLYIVSVDVQGFRKVALKD